MNRSKQAGMDVKAFVISLVVLTPAFVGLSEAQQQTKVPSPDYSWLRE